MIVKLLVVAQLSLLGAGAVAASTSQPAPHAVAIRSAAAIQATLPRAKAKSAPALVKLHPMRAVTKAKPAPHPKRAKARPHTTAPRTARRAPAPRPRRTTAPVPSSTPQQRMQQAVARIPGYPQSPATWLISSKYDSWGTADWYHNTIYISPKVPANRIYDVVSHEWSHLMSVKAYGGDVDTAVQAMSVYFEGGGLIGAERAADCMAILLGARWTNYTSCTSAKWQQGARSMLAGDPLPASS